MIRAILEDRKTQTRRVAKQFWVGSLTSLLDAGHTYCDDAGSGPVDQHCHYGLAGDRLWVRETWGYRGGAWNGARPDRWLVQMAYRADDSMQSHLIAEDVFTEWNVQRKRRDGESLEHYEDYLNKSFRDWRPSIFMPRWASRIQLEITDVRVQRLQEISEEDAKAEGITVFPLQSEEDRSAWYQTEPGVNQGPSPRSSFAQLWDSINAKKHPWDSNPWVWAISFRRLP